MTTIQSPPNQAQHIVENILVPHSAFEKALARLEQCFNYADGATEPMCVAVLGESRTGKSRVIEEFYTRHLPWRTAEGMVRPVVRLRTPPKPTVKGLADLMLTALGEKHDIGGTEQKKTAQIKRLLRSCGTRAVVVEEFNHFVDTASGKVAFHATDWLKDIADARNIMLCVSGLETCRKAISLNEQLAGRFSKPLIMPRFNWRNSKDRNEFRAILRTFEEALRSQYDLPDLSSEEMAFRFFCATGGVIGYVTKLLREVVLAAIRDNRTVIKLADLAEADEQAGWGNSTIELGAKPFCPEFSVTSLAQSNDDLLNRVGLIGTRTTDDPPIKKGRTAREKKPSLKSILSKKGE
jgi:hypothetical protein